MAFVSGLLTVAAVDYSAQFSSPEPVPPTTLTTTSVTVPHKARPKLSNCVDSARDPKIAKQRLTKIDQLRKKVEKLDREVRNSESFERGREVWEELVKIQQEINDLESIENGFGKTVYRENCY